MSDLFNLALLFSAIRLSTPLIYAALGGLFSERSGVINIALEGLMLAGAFTAAVATYELHNPFLGLLCGMAAGGALALVYAISVIKFQADQVVAGMAINFLMIGLPALISGAVYDSAGSTPQIAIQFSLPSFRTFITSNVSGILTGSRLDALENVIWLALGAAVVLLGSFIIFASLFEAIRKRRPVLKSALGSAAWVVAVVLMFYFSDRLSILSVLAFTIMPICWYVLYKTPFGLRLRAIGENPEAADAAGVNVLRLRYVAVTISGILAAAGGAYLSTGQSSLFTRNMTAGRGFIALAALILSKWRPVQALVACLFFGFTEALTIGIQGASWAKMPSGEDIPIQFIQMIPYVLTIIVLAGFIGLSRAPKALGIPYRKES